MHKNVAPKYFFRLHIIFIGEHTNQRDKQRHIEALRGSLCTRYICRERCNIRLKLVLVSGASIIGRWEVPKIPSKTFHRCSASRRPLHKSLYWDTRARGAAVNTFIGDNDRHSNFQLHLSGKNTVFITLTNLWTPYIIAGRIYSIGRIFTENSPRTRALRAAF